MSSYFGRDSGSAVLLLFLTGVLGAGVTIYIARSSEAPLTHFLLSPIGQLAGIGLFWWFHSDRTSPRYGGGAFFAIEMLLNFGCLLIGFASAALLYWAFRKFSK